MINIPRWLVILLAACVAAFGIFRLYVAWRKTRSADGDKPSLGRGGFYAQSAKRHAFFGILYLATGGLLVSMSLGFRPPILGQGCTEIEDGRAIEAETVIEADR